MKKKVTKLLSILLCLALMLTTLPGLTLTAFAAEGGKSVMWGTAGIDGGGKDYVYFGSYKQSSDGKGGYNVDPVKWRVLDANNSDNEVASPTNTTTNEAMLLLSEQNLDVQQYYPSYTPITWEKSSLRAWMNGTFYRAAFTAREQTAIAETHVKNPQNSMLDIPGGNDTYDKIFALCEAEVRSTAYGFVDNGFFEKYNDTRFATNTAYTASLGDSRGAGETDAWWLRSPGFSEGQAMYIDFYAGLLHSTGVEQDIAVRPAFNLNSDAVLFTTAAEGGKPQGFHAVSDYSANEWKLTLLDGSREFSATGADTLVNGKLSIVYANAETGENEYISAALVNKDGAVTYYGRLKNVADRSDASGTVEIDLSDITIRTSDTLYIFNEQDGGDYKTDFASEPISVTLPEEAFNAADVTFETNGGTINNGNVTYYAYGEGAVLPTDVTRNGYTFEGWYESENFSGNAVTAINTTEKGDKIYYAKWTALPAAAPTISSVSDDFIDENTLTYGGITADHKLTVTATADSGTEYDLTYQWYEADSADSKVNATAISGATSETYAIPTDLAAGEYYYYCTVTATRKDNGESAAVDTRIVSVTILPKTINTEIPLAKPVAAAAVQSEIETDEYTATVVWSPQAEGKFAYNTAYTAMITITPKANYTLAGIPENGYAADGAAAVVNAADSGNVSVIYAKTERGLASVTTSDNETTDYGSLEEAVTAAQSLEGSIVTLHKDIAPDSTVVIDSGAFTLDLSGKAITNSRLALEIRGSSEITLTDSSAGQSGRVTTAGEGNSAIALMDSASLTVSGGTLESFRSNAIDMSNRGRHSSSSLTIIGGKLIGGNVAVNAYGSSVTISGGVLKNKYGTGSHIHYSYGTLDFSGHTDPSGIVLHNGSGVAVKASDIALPDGFVFLNSDGSQVRTLAYGQQYTIGEIKLCPDNEHNWSNKDGVCVICGYICTHDFDEAYICTICGYVYPDIIRVGEAQLKDGQYLANGSATPTDTQPDGGYAYFKDGVLTLHDYVYSGNGSDYTDIDGTYSTAIGSWGSLVVNLEGASSLTNLSDDGDAITVGEGDLTITGEGTLNVSATYGFYVYDGDVTVEGGTLNIETGLDGIYSGNSTRIEDGAININTGDIGINASENIIISGGKLSVKSDGDGLYAYSGDVVVNGGETEIEAAVDGIYAYEGNITIEGGKSYVAAGGHGIDGVCVVISGADTIAVKGEVAVSAADSLTLDTSTHDIILPDGGSVGAKTVLDASGNTARAAYIVTKGLAEHSHEWASEYSFDAVHHFKPCVVQGCQLMNDPDLFRLLTDEHDFDDNNICTVCAINLWEEYGVIIGDVGLHNGEYLDNDGNVTTAQPTGGYAYYEEGVLTLSDYTYTGKGYNYGDGFSAAVLFGGDLEINLEGTNELINKAVGGEGISTENGSLTIGGSGSLSITATCGIYINGGSVTTGGGLDIDAVEVAVITKGGDVIVRGGTVSANAGYAGILAENGSVTIEGGEVSITAGVISIDSFDGAVWIKPADGRRISVYNASSADGEAIDGSPFTSETDITGLISGGAFYSVASGSSSSRPASPGGGSSVTRYTIKFETNGGSEVANQTVTRNSKLDEPEAPLRDGYSFIGWYTDEGLTTAYDFDSKVTKDFTLYAKWAKHDDEKPIEFENPFTDVNSGDWYYDDVRYVAENGLFNGTSATTFEPNSNITRAMLVTVLYRLEGEPEIASSGNVGTGVPDGPSVGTGVLDVSFTDVDPTAYYANAVAWAQQNGIVKGYSETEFRPDENIIREQIAAIMYRYASYKGYDVGNGDGDEVEVFYDVPFADASEISDYAIDGVMYCKLKGIMQGKDGNKFAPKDNATRAETAAILHRFIEANR